MNSMFLAFLVALCVLCYAGQSFFNKLFSGSYPGPAAEATPVFAFIYGVVVAITTFFMNGMQFSPSPLTWILGGFNGAALFLFNLGMIQAARRGPYAIQSIVMIFGSIVVSLVFSSFFFGDRLTAIQGIGIALMLIAFIALNLGGAKMSGMQKGFIPWLILVFFSNGAYSVLNDAQQRMISTERNEMIMVTFTSSAVISLVYLLIIKRGKIAEAFRMGQRSAVMALLSSISAAFAVFILMFLLHYIPSYILYTISNGALLVVLTLLSAFLLKEKLHGITLAGIVLSVISIIILS